MNEIRDNILLGLVVYMYMAVAIFTIIIIKNRKKKFK